MADSMTTAKNKIQETSDACGQAAANASEGLKSGANYVMDQVKDAAGNAAKAASYLDSKAEEATAAVGSRLKSAGEAIRQHLPQEGQLGEASAAVAQTLSDTGDYLKRQGLEGMGGDLTKLIQQNPFAAMFVGIGLGFLIARATTPRN